MNRYIKASIVIAVEFLLAFVVLILFVISALSTYLKDANYYTPVVLIFGILLLILIPFTFYRKSKRIKYGWMFWFAGLFIAIGIYEGLKAYHRSIPTITGTKVNLELYQPFSDTTLVARLDEPATLKLTDSLPRIDGATAFYPLYSAFVRAVYPEAYYDKDTSIVACHTTNLAYPILSEYKGCDMIFAFEPSVQQREEVADSVELELTPIGRESFIFFVNAHNPIDNITSKQLRSIYSGEITNWKEVGGNDERIRPFQRNEGSGSQTIFLRFMEGYPVMTPPRDGIQSFMEGIIYVTADYANYKNAIGYSFRYFSKEMVGNNQIKILSVDGVYPDLETLRNSSYPLVYEFYAVTRKGDVSPNTRKLIDWILSPQGQYLVEKTGYCPVNPL